MNSKDNLENLVRSGGLKRSRRTAMSAKACCALPLIG